MERMDTELFNISNILTAAAFIIALAVFYGLLRFVWKKIKKTHDDFFEMLFQHLNGPVQVIFLLSAVYAVLQKLDYPWTDEPFVGKIYAIGMIAGLGWLALRGTSFVGEIILKRFDVAKQDNLSARMVHTQIKVVRRLVKAIIVILALAAALMTFEQIRALGVSLLASAGVAGIVLGMAAQKTIGNFFTGLQIAITQPIRLDDVVIVEGEWGWIEEINLTYVVVKVWDLRRLVVPINYFVERPFQNWTRTSADILGTVYLYVDYTMPLEPIRDELTRILKEEAGSLWDGKVNGIQVTNTTDKVMEVRVLVSSADSPKAWDLRCLVRERLVDFMQENYPDHLPVFRAEIPGFSEQRVAESA